MTDDDKTKTVWVTYGLLFYTAYDELTLRALRTLDESNVVRI